jgi:hypothetical protein
LISGLINPKLQTPRQKDGGEGFRIGYINELDSYLMKKILDRIYRIDWIFLFFPHFPEENEEA